MIKNKILIYMVPNIKKRNKEEKIYLESTFGDYFNSD